MDQFRWGGSAFTDRLFRFRKRAATGQHELDQLCTYLGIEHRLTSPMGTQTNGIVERFNGRMEDVLQSHRFQNGEDFEQTIRRYVAPCNNQLPRSALPSRMPLQAMKDFHKLKTDLFKKQPYYLAGRDTYCPNFKYVEKSMISRTLPVSLLLAVAPMVAIAGEAKNILSCMQSVEAYTGKSVNEFDVRYQGRILGFSSAEWPGVACDVLLGSVYNLTIDGHQYVYEGFAGQQAKIAYEILETETKDAISLLESRVQLLERRLENSRNALRLPDPDIEGINNHVREGIVRATGNTRQ